jgi:hypothetical protein
VVVDGAHVDAVLPQRPRDGIDLLVEEHEVARGRGFTIGQGLEIENGHDADGGQQGHAILRDGLRARDRALEHASAEIAAGTTECALDLLRVDGGPGRRAGWPRDAQRGRARR